MQNRAQSTVIFINFIQFYLINFRTSQDHHQQTTFSQPPPLSDSHFLLAHSTRNGMPITPLPLSFRAMEGKMLTILVCVGWVSSQVPGGGEPILVSSVPFREISLCTNTSIYSLSNARKNAEIDWRVFKLLCWRLLEVPGGGGTHLGELCAISGGLYMH
jgi:hypothetical protein